VEKWKRARLTAWAAVVPHLKHPATPEQWLPMRGDSKKKRKWSKEKAEALLKRMQEWRQTLIDKGLVKQTDAEAAAMATEDLEGQDPEYLEGLELRQRFLEAGVFGPLRNKGQKGEDSKAQGDNAPLPKISEIRENLPKELQKDAINAVLAKRTEQSNEAWAAVMSNIKQRKEQKAEKPTLSEILKTSPLKISTDETPNTI